MGDGRGRLMESNHTEAFNSSAQLNALLNAIKTKGTSFPSVAQEEIDLRCMHPLDRGGGTRSHRSLS